MSAFLGPIHYWLYNKIQLQEEWIDDIMKLSIQQGWPDVSPHQLDRACGELKLHALEDVIDGGNIHGWLHERIGRTETRLAYLITALLKADASRLPALKQAARAFGEKHALQSGTGADEAFRAIEDTLLDGMPCDHVNRVIKTSSDKVVWEKTQCVHTEYWERVGGDVAVYNALREAILTGMLANSGLALHALGGDTYEISREERKACTA